MTHLKIEKLIVTNFEGALRGMRNPLESWNKSDSGYNLCGFDDFCMGSRDLALAKKLVKAGSDHRKFLRQIFISCDIIAPWYWWKEYETYQVGTVENSTSQMHKLGSRTLDEGDFVFDILSYEGEVPADSSDIDFEYAISETQDLLLMINNKIERWRKFKNDGKYGNIFWRDMIQCIPGSFIYRRTCTLNYEVMRNMYKSRNNHKLIEWREFCTYMVHNLPCADSFIV